MSTVNVTCTDIQQLQQLGLRCEVHTRDAARCLAADKLGPSKVHADLARSYSKQAFALARRVHARGSA